MKARVSKKAKLGKGVRVGAGTVVYDNVVIGDGTVIDEHCEIGCPTGLAQGKPLVIGARSRIRSHSVFYEGSVFGDDLGTGHYVLARERCRVGRGLSVGTRCDLEGDLEIGDWVRAHSGVHVAKGTVIGDFAFLSPRVMITNDPFPPSFVTKGVTIGDMAVVASGVLLMPGVTVGMGAFVAAASVVRADVPELQCAAGDPAAVFAPIDRFFSPEHGRYHPWVARFRDRYPKASWPAMRRTLARVERALAARARPAAS